MNSTAFKQNHYRKRVLKTLKTLDFPKDKGKIALNTFLDKTILWLQREVIHFGIQSSNSLNLGSPTAEKEFSKAAKGSIMPVYKTMAFDKNPVEFFSKLSKQGKKENCILLESADVMKRLGEKSLGSAEPCIKASGKGNKFEITALNQLGQKLLLPIAQSLNFCNSVKAEKTSIKGILRQGQGIVSEQERLKAKTQAGVLRAIAFQFKPAGKKFPVSSGLFGSISYDFIDQFEKLPKAKADPLNEPDYEMLFLDNLFLIDHEKKEIAFIANAFKTGLDDEKELERCSERIAYYEKALKETNSKQEKAGMPGKKVKLSAKSDCPKQEYMAMVEKCKEHILKGDVFQIVPSRTISVETKAKPLEIYRALRRLNPSPYMFFMHSETGTLLGSSPETFLKVEGNGEKKIEIRPIAGTRPRGLVNGKVDLELDSRYENELKTDEKELAEHTMLVDLARNDVARVSKPGSRLVGKVHYVEKFSHVMHLVSNVSGTLKPGLDALHAYLASMNMGTLTGAPKVKAMELLRKYEKTKRGFYGGSIGYLTPAGDFDSAIVIRSMKVKNGTAFIRAGGGVVFDSIAEKEFLETENKAKACLKAIEEAEADLQ